MTDQELFDKVATHLLKQGIAAMKKDLVEDYVMCSYRAPGGLSCAIGCLIPDERYDPALEGQTGNSFMVMEAAGLSPDQGLLATRLQHAHDNQLRFHGIEGWKKEMYIIAKHHGLNSEVLK